jgi:hypothetical protein
MNMNSKLLVKAENVVRIVETVLQSRTGTDPNMIERWVLERADNGNVWLFAVLDDQRLGKFEPYEKAAHHLSSSLRGMPVIIGNHTGLRYGFLLTPRPALPDVVQYAQWKKGVMQLGMGMRGKPIEIGYGDLSHTIVAGMTRFGKSNLLRLMALQAKQEGWQLALGDPDGGRTFGKFANDPALICPIGKTLDATVAVVGRVQELMQERARLFDALSSMPDDLAEYNETAETQLAPVLVMLDEFNGTVMATGGVNGSFAQATTIIAWQAAKFGIRLVLAGQDFSKDIVGPVREQMMTRICLRVENATVSSVVLGRAGAEALAVPGRAMTNRWGTIQTYFVDKSQIGKDAIGLTSEERTIAEYIISKHNGRMTQKALEDFGITQRRAREVRADWMKRGLAEIKPDRDNALCLTAIFDAPTGSCVRADRPVRAENQVEEAQA